MTVSLTSELIVIDRIKVDPDHKPDPSIVRQLILSIPLVGLLQPIILCRPGTGLGVKLVFGRNRIEACKKLKHRAILSRVVNGASDEIAEWCRIAARDENMIRRICSIPPDAPTVTAIAAWRDQRQQRIAAR